MLNNKHLFLKVPETEKPKIKVLEDLVRMISLCPHRAKATHPIHEGTTLIT